MRGISDSNAGIGWWWMHVDELLVNGSGPSSKYHGYGYLHLGSRLASLSLTFLHRSRLRRVPYS